ncbi:protein kinase family protein [Corynebacterium sp. CCUG 71335]|uniref:protein kinase family protein n=1 Tax=Corynebacterium sp. CCUG 71335 TaxID=2823892 RepID=UPI00210D40CC|nr:protein kinase family protein [Corynebacterium sp. CCUG 71335]MCQ4620695.1 protein kinase family protein [Corynebacterium sp. CCUG 71335]
MAHFFIDPKEMALKDFQEKYAPTAVASAFIRLYPDEQLGHMFAVLHQSLNEHFSTINDRARTTSHFWAENSRDLISLIAEIRQALHDLKRVGVEVELDEKYEKAMEACEEWLSPSGGSSIPEDFSPLEVIRYQPVFTQGESTVLAKSNLTPQLKMVGEGSYAIVYSYVDPDYGTTFALKRAKKGIEDRELERFKREFDVMKELSFPYIVEVYSYNEEKNEYRMEYCDDTLREYIKRRNNTLSFGSRRSIALQFLYGLNYIHREGILHRDISLQNILLKVYNSSAVLVKLSDFGLMKEQSSQFTRTHTEMRGTIIDPTLQSFRDYTVVNEIYAAGYVLAYIFTGREDLKVSNEDVQRIVHKCITYPVTDRYQTVMEIIAEVEELKTSG